MHSSVTDSNSFSPIKVTVLCLSTLGESNHKLMALVCTGDLFTYCHIMRGVEVILWVLRGSKYDCSSVTYISKNCLCYYFSTLFLQLGINYNESIWYV